MSESSTTPILVIDDEAIALKLVTRLLQRIGFTDVDTAMNGVEGRRLMEKKLYGLVVCDWNMPEMSGLDLLKIVRTTDRWKRLPFVMTSIDGSLERVKIARMTGVSAFLLKPFDETQLRTKLEEVLPTSLPKRKPVFSIPVTAPEPQPATAKSA